MSVPSARCSVSWSGNRMRICMAANYFARQPMSSWHAMHCRLDFASSHFDYDCVARVVIVHLTKVFDSPRGQVIRALEDVNVTVEDKELMVLVGPSGCGKTTLLRLMAGLGEVT